MDQKCDLITGGPLPDNDDEYVRQKVESYLLRLGYQPRDIRVAYCRTIRHRDEEMCVTADLLIMVEDAPALVLRCARGSLVSREREAVAAARLLDDSWIPLTVVCNGDDAELLDVNTARIISTGLEAIPGPVELAHRVGNTPRKQPSEKEKIAAARVYHAYSFIQCPGQCTV